MSALGKALANSGGILVVQISLFWRWCLLKRAEYELGKSVEDQEFTDGTATNCVKALQGCKVELAQRNADQPLGWKKPVHWLNNCFHWCLCFLRIVLLRLKLGCLAASDATTAGSEWRTKTENLCVHMRMEREKAKALRNSTPLLLRQPIIIASSILVLFAWIEAGDGSFSSGRGGDRKDRTLATWREFQEAVLLEAERFAQLDVTGLKVRLTRLDMEDVDSDLVRHIRDWVDLLSAVQELFSEIQTEAASREAYSSQARTLGRIAGILAGEDVARDGLAGELIGQIFGSTLTSVLGREKEAYFIAKIQSLTGSVNELKEKKRKMKQLLEKRYGVPLI